MKLQNEEVILKTLNTLIYEQNRPVHKCKWETFQEKSIYVF